MQILFHTLQLLFWQRIFFQKSYGGKFHKIKTQHGQFVLTRAERSRVRVVPGAVDLAANDSLTPVVISRVAYEYHYRVILVLSSIYEPPPPMFHSGVANVGAGHRWKVRG